MKNIFKRGLLLPAALLLTGCVATQDYDTLRAQVTQHDQVIQRLNSQLSGVQPAQADTWSQVQSLRQEIGALRGEVESMNHAFTQAGGAQAMADMLSRHERALRLIETQLAMDLQLSQPAGPLTPGMTYPTTPEVPGMPPTVTTPPTTTTPPANVARPQSTDTAQALYDAGINAFNSKNYQSALRSFTDFTTTYPKHTLAANSWFWQGECHYQMKNYAEAALAYEKVITTFPNSNKAPAAYLKQGLAFLQLGKKDAARERLNELIKKFPKAPEAIRAQQEIKNNKL